MNKYYYTYLSNWERRKIESLIDNKPILKPISGITDHGWDVITQKGAVENLNRLVRIVYPKSFNFSQYLKMELIIKLRELMEFIKKPKVSAS